MEGDTLLWWWVSTMSLYSGEQHRIMVTVVSECMVNISRHTRSLTETLIHTMSPHTHTCITHSFTHMWQSWIEIEYCSVTYFECITKFDTL